MKRNSVEIADRKNQLVKRNLDILSLCKQEVRELSEEEEQEFKANEDEISELDEEAKALEEELENDEKESEKEEKSQKNISIDKNMEKKNFSIAEEIKRSMETHQPIILNSRAVMSAANEGEDTIATSLWDVWAPLRANNVLVDAGMKVYSGLVGDVQVPLYNKGNVQWKGETSTAEDGNGSFTSVTLSPRRITGKFPISLQFLAQTTPDVEAVIREDIALAVWEKIESTLLGSAAGTSTQPAGFAYGLAETSVSDYSYLTAMEAGLEEKNYKNISFICAPKAKAAFKSMIKGQTGPAGMVFEGGEVDGYPTGVTSNMTYTYFLAGDFSQAVCGLWDEVRIDTVADSQTLADGQIMVIVNAFADAKVCRPDAIALGKVE